MGVSAIGQSSTAQTSQSGQDYSSQIQNLEKQKTAVQAKISKLNQDKKISATEKQQEIEAYQLQMQTIQSQIQQLEQKQTQSKQTSSSTSDATSSQSSLSTDATKQLIRQSVDVEA